ncbi:MAG: hypothetical protein R3D26_10695 [Cyanobacteriota/Melainabacteria group bacterium]
MPVDETSINQIGFGPVSKIELPSTWVEQPHQIVTPAHPELLNVSSPEDDRVQICLYYRGCTGDSTFGREFRKLPE